jgi:hypothetical protein
MAMEIEKATTCPNCGARLTGPYCGRCGQRQVDLDRPFRDLIREGLSAFFAFDTRLLRSLWPLVARPGFLTGEFLAGRRARYVQPFKLYFALSVVFFLALSWSGYQVVRLNAEGLVTITTNDENATPPGTGEQPAAADPAALDRDRDSPVLSRLLSPLIELAENDPDELSRIFTDRLAKLAIILVPVFAALLQLAYWQPRYLAHLVFSLHLHSFAFLAIVVGIGFDLLSGAVEGEGPGGAVASAVIFVYAFLALRRVYAGGGWATVLKLLMLLFGYVVALVVTMILTLAATAAFL